MNEIESRFDEPVPDKELLKIASAFDLGPEPIVNGQAFWWRYFPKEAHLHHMYLKKSYTDNDDRFIEEYWYIRNDWGRLSYRGEVTHWSTYSPITSFESIQNALYFYKKWRNAVLCYAKEKYQSVGLDVTNDLSMKKYKSVVVEYSEVPDERFRFG